MFCFERIVSLIVLSMCNQGGRHLIIGEFLLYPLHVSPIFWAFFLYPNTHVFCFERILYPTEHEI